MILIGITSTNGEEKLFKDYTQACEYLNGIEKRKKLEPGVKVWRFIRRRYDTLSSLYYRTPSLKDVLTLKEIEAVEKRVGLIEIVKGDREHVTQLLFTKRLDIEPLKKDWCKEYCLEHGFTCSEFVLDKNQSIQNPSIMTRLS